MITMHWKQVLVLSVCVGDASCAVFSGVWRPCCSPRSRSDPVWAALGLRLAGEPCHCSQYNQTCQQQPCEMRTSCEIRTPPLVPKCCSQCKWHPEMRTPLTAKKMTHPRIQRYSETCDIRTPLGRVKSVPNSEVFSQNLVLELPSRAESEAIQIPKFYYFFASL
jgi:hypothetical protein